MQTKMPVHIFHDILLIVNAYGAYLRERQLTKEFKNSAISNIISSGDRKLRNYESDPYSWSARESGCVDGLSQMEISSISRDLQTSLENEHNIMVKNLISSEKYFKKLKHQFNEKYPSEADNLAQIIKQHQDNHENNKRMQYNAHQNLINLSKRFISFFRHISKTTSGNKMIFNEFMSNMSSKYKFTSLQKTNEYHELVRLLDVSDFSTEIAIKKSPKFLKLEQIDYISIILKDVLEQITEDDINNSFLIDDIENPTEKDLLKRDASKSLQVKFRSFNKLYNEYLELRPKLEVLI